MNELSPQIAIGLGICIFFTIAGMLIVKFLFDKYKL
jgi:hypothetical protein